MRDGNIARIERNVARCRLLLSLTTPLAVYLDPTEPILLRFSSVPRGSFFIDPYARAILLAHLAYSAAVYLAVASNRVSLRRIAAWSSWGDVLFAVMVALVTEGTNSPFYVYFLFAVLAAGVRGASYAAMRITVASLVLYLAIFLVARPEGLGFYLTRVAYLAITGYLVAYLARQRRILETNLQGLTRSLHDGYVQALAGVNLRVETCRELIRRGQDQEAFTELTELQNGVTREYDKLRAHVRSLVGLETTPAPPIRSEEIHFSVRADFTAPLGLVEHVLQIMAEGARNASRHAAAGSARIEASSRGDEIVITLDDDGVGFPAGATAPWSIASRAAEVGGTVRIREDASPGAHVVVELPA